MTEYKAWIDNMGDFRLENNSNLRLEINLFNQIQVFGTPITVDLNGNPRDIYTVIGCYDKITDQIPENPSEIE